jgi:TonB family protein
MRAITKPEITTTQETFGPSGTASTSTDNSTEREFNLLRERDRHEDWRHWRVDAAVSAGIHAVLLLVLLLMPESPVRPPEELRPVRHVTPIFIPTDLTQKAPNKEKIQKEMTVEAIAPRPRVRIPSPAPAAPQTPAPPRTFVEPPKEAVAEQPKPVVAEPPKIQLENPPTSAPVSPFAPPPSVEPPKLALQQVAPPPAPQTSQGKVPGIVPLPNSSVQEAIHNLARSGQQSGQSVGDIGADEGGFGAGLNLPPSAGRPRSNLELKSDPMGVDFRPYLLQVLAAVRRNWFAVYPEAARLGQRGQVVMQFAISKQGAVPKIVFSTESGAKALDQAAVAAISASNPLPPLPAEFKGDRVVLQMTFLYNMPR